MPAEDVLAAVAHSLLSAIVRLLIYGCAPSICCTIVQVTSSLDFQICAPSESFRTATNSSPPKEQTAEMDTLFPSPKPLPTFGFAVQVFPSAELKSWQSGPPIYSLLPCFPIEVTIDPAANRFA